MPARVGLGTLRMVLRLWRGVSPSRSGVQSAGNGAAMRSALIGVLGETDQHVRELVAASSVITHADPGAMEGATAVALGARRAAEGKVDGIRLLHELAAEVKSEDLRAALDSARRALSSFSPTAQFVGEMGLQRGVTGSVNHTVPAALLCWLTQRGSFRGAVEEAVALGGDAGTVAAITGASTSALGPLLVRNAGFASLVLGHGARRLLPPNCDPDATPWCCAPVVLGAAGLVPLPGRSGFCSGADQL